jgi:hypothetical protein
MKAHRQAASKPFARVSEEEKARRSAAAEGDGRGSVFDGGSVLEL